MTSFIIILLPFLIEIQMHVMFDLVANGDVTFSQLCVCSQRRFRSRNRYHFRYSYHSKVFSVWHNSGLKLEVVVLNIDIVYITFRTLL